MSELRDRQSAAATVLLEAEAAHERGELSLEVYLGMRLFIVAMMMKDAHQPGARKVAREYAEFLEMDAVLLESQMEMRIMEVLEFNRLANESGVGS